MAKKTLVILLIGSAIFFLAYLTSRPTISIPESKTNTVAESSDSKSSPQIISGMKFDLSGKGYSTFPMYILTETSMVELNLSNNNLTGALPAEIRQLQNLQVLNVSNNKMTGVPAEIGQLSKLEILDLSNNQLTGLPYEMGNLKNLRILNLSGNNYAKQDLEIIKKGLSPTVQLIL